MGSGSDQSDAEVEDAHTRQLETVYLVVTFQIRSDVRTFSYCAKCIVPVAIFDYAQKIMYCTVYCRSSCLHDISTKHNIILE
jgi:hypothetical protein